MKATLLNKIIPFRQPHKKFNKLFHINKRLIDIEKSFIL